MTIVVGGVGQLFQGDLDVGRHVTERLASADLGSDVVVEDFYYGAVAVMQRLQDLQPRALVLIGAERAGAAPGTVRRRRIRARPAGAWEIQDAVGAAATGHVAIPLIVEVAAGFGALPHRSAAIEVEPASVEPGAELTAAVTFAVPRAYALTRCELLHMRVLDQADRLSLMLRQSGRSAASRHHLELELLAELRRLDDEGEWGAAPVIAARLRNSQSARPEPASQRDAGDGAVLTAADALLDTVEETIRVEASLKAP